MDANINIIKAVVHEFLPGSKILLFGSRARGTNRQDSDYDILVLIDNELSPREKMPFRTAIRRKLIDWNIISEILVQSNQEAKLKKSLPGHIIGTAFKEGVWI